MNNIEEVPQANVEQTTVEGDVKDYWESSIAEKSIKQISAEGDFKDYWEDFIADHGLHFVTGGECTGKSIYVDTLAVDSAKAMGVEPSEILYLQVSEVGRIGNNVRSYEHPPIYENRAEYDLMLAAWIDKIRDEIKASNTKVIVLDEIRNSLVMQFAVELSRDYAVFAVFGVPAVHGRKRFVDVYSRHMFGDEDFSNLQVPTIAHDVRLADTKLVVVTNDEGEQALDLYVDYKTVTLPFPL